MEIPVEGMQIPGGIGGRFMGTERLLKLFLLAIRSLQIGARGHAKLRHVIMVRVFIDLGGVKHGLLSMTLCVAPAIHGKFV
eukprot:1140908-Pelagomonas_calceolata.AAC.6